MFGSSDQASHLFSTAQTWCCAMYAHSWRLRSYVYTSASRENHPRSHLLILRRATLQPGGNDVPALQQPYASNRVRCAEAFTLEPFADLTTSVGQLAWLDLTYRASSYSLSRIRNCASFGRHRPTKLPKSSRAQKQQDEQTPIKAVQLA